MIVNSDSVTLFNSFAHRVTEWGAGSNTKSPQARFSDGHYYFPLMSELVESSIIVYTETSTGKTILPHQYIAWAPTTWETLSTEKRKVEVLCNGESVIGYCISLTPEYIEILVDPEKTEDISPLPKRAEKHNERLMIFKPTSVRYSDNVYPENHVKVRVNDKAKSKIFVSYLTNSLSWTGSYDIIADLNIEPQRFPLLRYRALLRNLSGQSIDFTKTTIVSGKVRMLPSYNQVASRSMILNNLEVNNIEKSNDLLGEYVKYGLGQMRLEPGIVVNVFSAVNVPFRKIYFTEIPLAHIKDENNQLDKLQYNEPIQYGYIFDSGTIFKQEQNEQLPLLLPEGDVKLYTTGSRGNLIGNYIGSAHIPEIRPISNEESDDTLLVLGTTSSLSISSLLERREESRDVGTPLLKPEKGDSISVRSYIINKLDEPINFIIRYRVEIDNSRKSDADISTGVDIAEQRKNGVVEFLFPVEANSKVNFLVKLPLY